MKITQYTKTQADQALILVKRILTDLKHASSTSRKSYFQKELEQLGLIILDLNKPSIIFPSHNPQCIYYYELKLNKIQIYDFSNTSISL